MCDPIASCGFFCQKKGLTALPSLPGPFLDPPHGVVQRLSCEGIITKKGSMRIHSVQRNVWQPGPNWGRFREWWEKHSALS
jgi:hypothetical protein